MPKMPDIFGGLVREWDQAEHAVASHMPHHHAATETPAQQPVNLAATPVAAATPQEEPMSVITDAEDLYAGAKSELAKFEQALPGALAKAKQFEASPFAQLAEKAAGTVLPPEAVTVAVNAANKVLDDLLELYTPAQATEAPAQQPVPAQ